MKYKLETQFIFTGEFTIEAENAEEAQEFFLKHCGLVIGGDIHSTLPDEDVDWDFAVHPDKVILNIETIN